MRSSSGGGMFMRVGSGHEHHVGQVVLDFDVVIDEGVVLLGIEHFQQRRGRIAAEVHPHLVHFVEQEQRIAHADLGHVLQDLARHRADVGAAMAADLGLVAHAAQRHADELAIGSARDRLAERSLAHAGRPDQAQDRRLHLVHALLHRQVLDDALLHLLQPVVVLFEDGLGLGQVRADLALLLPRQPDQRLDVVAHDRGFGRHRRHQPQLLQLGLGLLPGFLGHVRGLDALFHLVEVGALFHIAQLFLDRLDLLVQVVLALALLHLLLDATADALLDLQDVELGLHQRQQVLEALCARRTSPAPPASARA